MMIMIMMMMMMLKCLDDDDDDDDDVDVDEYVNDCDDEIFQMITANMMIRFDATIILYTIVFMLLTEASLERMAHHLRG